MSNRCLYYSTFSEFLQTDAPSIYYAIRTKYHGGAYDTTDEAWEEEIEVLQHVLLPWKDENAHIIFEYDIPRLGKRIDVVLLLQGLIFCLEFKVGKKTCEQADIEQVLDYALDLKNFHEYSATRRIVPILVPTNFQGHTSTIQYSVYDCDIYNPFITGESNLQQIISSVLEHDGGQKIIPNEWGSRWLISPYKPTPTIVEAARTLYQNHSVKDITRHEADDAATDATTNYVLSVIERSKRNHEKSICFVTGVPGAGKTLVGLQVAINQTYKDGAIDEENGAVYLSGNGPLVAVLTEALARDDRDRNNKNITDSRREVSTFIQIIHRYRDNMLKKIKNPVENGKLEIDPNAAVEKEKSGYGEVEHVAIFDEAQRSWTHKKLAEYLKKGGTYGNKLKVPNFPVSEAAFLIWSLDQRNDWAVIVCLVGGGQEIHTGEAGIAEWIEALNTQYKHWKVYISDKLTAPEYAEGRMNELLQENTNVTFRPELHLAVSMRSFRAEQVSDFVHCLLSLDHEAASLYKDIMARNYPILLTRDINTAREWLRSKAIGSLRTGVLISKTSARYRPQAIRPIDKTSGDINTVHWFLEDKTDVRSSNYLEEAATEIEVQGLELDYTCVLWDPDMRYSPNGWEFKKFNGSKNWTDETNAETRNYMLNGYRVLLTRARQGMIICVPKGNNKRNAEGLYEDQTRLPEYYDSTYNYLKSLGIEEI